MRTDTPPLAARRSSRATTYRSVPPARPATSNTNRTVPRATVGASASATVRALSQRGTDPYSANVIASITVDLPEPVGPTRAKYSTPAKSTVVGSRKDPNPAISSSTGRISR